MVLYKAHGANRDSQGTLESNSPIKFNKARPSLESKIGGKTDLSAENDEYTAHDQATGTPKPAIGNFELRGQSLKNTPKAIQESKDIRENITEMRANTGKIQVFDMRELNSRQQLLE